MNRGSVCCYFLLGTDGKTNRIGTLILVMRTPDPLSRNYNVHLSQNLPKQKLSSSAVPESGKITKSKFKIGIYKQNHIILHGSLNIFAKNKLLAQTKTWKNNIQFQLRIPEWLSWGQQTNDKNLAKNRLRCRRKSQQPQQEDKRDL